MTTIQLCNELLSLRPPASKKFFFLVSRDSYFVAIATPPQPVSRKNHALWTPASSHGGSRMSKITKTCLSGSTVVQAPWLGFRAVSLFCFFSFSLWKSNWEFRSFCCRKRNFPESKAGFFDCLTIFRVQQEFSRACTLGFRSTKLPKQAFLSFMFFFCSCHSWLPLSSYAERITTRISLQWQFVRTNQVEPKVYGKAQTVPRKFSLSLEHEAFAQNLELAWIFVSTALITSVELFFCICVEHELCPSLEQNDSILGLFQHQNRPAILHQVLVGGGRDRVEVWVGQEHARGTSKKRV